MVNLDEDRFQRHSLGQILWRSLRIGMTEWGSFLALALLLALPTAVMNALALPRLQQIQDEMDEALVDPDKAQEIMEHVNRELATFFQHWWWVFVALALVGAVVKAAIIRTAAQSFVQQNVTIGFNLKHGIRLLPTFLWWFVLYVFGFVVYMVAVLLVMGILVLLVAVLFPQDVAVLLALLLYMAMLATTYYIAMILTFCAPAIVVERATAVQSFVRAWTMTRGQRCLIFCTFILLFVAAVVTGLLQLWAVHAWHVGPMAHAVTNAAVSLVFIPLGGIVITVLYIYVRIVNEGCNRDVLVKDLRESTADPTSSGENAPNAALLDVDDSDNSARLEEALLPESAQESEVVGETEEV